LQNGSAADETNNVNSNSENELKSEKKALEDDEDPLDAFMKAITDDTPSKVKSMSESTSVNKSKTETIIATKKVKKNDEPTTSDSFLIKKEPIVKMEANETLEETTSTSILANGESVAQPTKKVEIMSVVTKKSTTDKTKEKGSIMEQDIDGLEYSSDEEALGGTETSLIDSVPKIKTKSEMVFTNHSKVYYRPFRKNFYVEVPEINSMTNEEVEAFKEELEGIKIRGKNCPKPIKTWAQCGVSFKVLEVLKRNNFEKPTPIQAQGIPIIMSGRDMIGIAKTGSGKTLAFLLPMFRHILDQPPLEVDDGPISIIMTPTRELAMQIAKECKKFTKHLNLNVVPVYGGTNISEQIAELKRGAEIIVCTPGRMIDMLAANNGKLN
jgi:ATP-dependent RNA helicase DDX46/PRP5